MLGNSSKYQWPSLLSVVSIQSQNGSLEFSVNKAVRLSRITASCSVSPFPPSVDQLWKFIYCHLWADYGGLISGDRFIEIFLHFSSKTIYNFRNAAKSFLKGKSQSTETWFTAWHWTHYTVYCAHKTASTAYLHSHKSTAHVFTVAI